MSSTNSTQPFKQAINPAAMHTSVAPLSKGMLVNGTLYISGQVGCGADLDKDGNRVFSDDVKVQAEECLNNIGHVLKEAGMTFDNVVKISIYLSNIEDWEKVNTVYEKYFKELFGFPARTAIEAGKLPLHHEGNKVEMDGVAVIKTTEQKIHNMSLTSSTSTQPFKQSINPEAMHKSVAPLSKGMLANDTTLYISGQVGCGADLDKDEKRVFSDDVKVQAEECLNNVGCVLREAGMTFDNIVKMSIYLSDIKDWEKVNVVYATYFKKPFPARTAIQAGKLPLHQEGNKVEMDGVAVRSLEF